MRLNLLLLAFCLAVDVGLGMVVGRVSRLSQGLRQEIPQLWSSVDVDDSRTEIEALLGPPARGEEGGRRLVWTLPAPGGQKELRMAFNATGKVESLVLTVPWVTEQGVRAIARAAWSALCP